MWNLLEVDDYIRFNAIDNEDYLACTDDLKLKFLNVSKRTLTRAYKQALIPNEAIYIFASVLSANFNDTTVMAQRGIASFSVDGISITFKDWAKKELDDLITDDVRDIITDANPDYNGTSRVRWVTL